MGYPLSYAVGSVVVGLGLPHIEVWIFHGLTSTITLPAAMAIIMKGSSYGVIMDIVLGIVGAVVSGFIVRTLGFAGQRGMIYTIIVVVIGTVMSSWAGCSG